MLYEGIADLQHVSLVLGGMRLSVSQLLLEMLHLAHSLFSLILQL